MKFSVIVSDNPWNFSDHLKMSTTKRGADANYTGTLSTEELCTLDVDSVSDPNGCVLCLWAVNSMLGDALTVMKSWGFQQKQIYTWVKTTDETNSKLGFGMGRMFRGATEHCLIGIKGKNVYKTLDNKSQRNVSLDKNLGHSKKPESLQDSLEIMWPNAIKLEMFARRHRDGWYCAGNELQVGEDISVSLKNLASDTNLSLYSNSYNKITKEE